MNDPYAVAEGLGLTVAELSDMLRREAARELRQLAEFVVCGEHVPDSHRATHLLLLVEQCELAWDEVEAGGASTIKEASPQKAGDAARVGHHPTATMLG